VQVTSQANIPLTGLVVTVPSFPSVACPEGLSTLAVGASLTCTASLTYTQDLLEAGDKSYTAVVTGTQLDAPATSPPLKVVVQAAPRLAVDVMAGNCTKPTRAGERACSLSVLLCRGACMAAFSTDPHPCCQHAKQQYVLLLTALHCTCVCRPRSSRAAP
jgi:hypothetical protein